MKLYVTLVINVTTKQKQLVVFKKHIKSVHTARINSPVSKLQNSNEL